MSRLMSVSHTTEQVRNRTKSVTRRKGWWEDKNGRRLLKRGDTLTLCEKVMGRFGPCPEGCLSNPVRGCRLCGGSRYYTAPLVRLAEVEVVSVAREPLWWITRAEREGDTAAEGFPTWTSAEFVNFFTETFGGHNDQMVTRIEWRYLDNREEP